MGPRSPVEKGLQTNRRGRGALSWGGHPRDVQDCRIAAGFEFGGKLYQSRPEDREHRGRFAGCPCCNRSRDTAGQSSLACPGRPISFGSPPTTAWRRWTHRAGSCSARPPWPTSRYSSSPQRRSRMPSRSRQTSAITDTGRNSSAASSIAGVGNSGRSRPRWHVYSERRGGCRTVGSGSIRQRMARWGIHHADISAAPTLINHKPNRLATGGYQS